MGEERSGVSTHSLVTLPAAVLALFACLSAFGNIHGTGTFILLIALAALLLISLAVVPMNLLRAHGTLRSVPQQKSWMNLAKIASGWMYLIGLVGWVAGEVIRSW